MSTLILKNLLIKINKNNQKKLYNNSNKYSNHVSFKGTLLIKWYNLLINNKHKNN